MTSARPTLDGLVARALGEAIESVTTPPVRDAIVTDALRTAGRSSIPERGPEVLEFATGPLQHALSVRVGDETAAEMLRQLRPVLQRAALRASVTPRPRGMSPPSPLRPTRPAGPMQPAADEESGVFLSHRAVTDRAPSAAIPLVFLASRDADLAMDLAVRLAGRATVRVVDGLLDLLDAFDEDDEGELRIVVLDGREPAVQVPSVVTVAPELSGRAHGLLWRCTRADRDALDAHSAAGAWTACGDTLDDLARACSMLVDAR